jgi:hypothetical protein
VLSVFFFFQGLFAPGFCSAFLSCPDRFIRALCYSLSLSLANIYLPNTHVVGLAHILSPLLPHHPSSIARSFLNFRDSCLGYAAYRLPSSSFPFSASAGPRACRWGDWAGTDLYLSMSKY